MAEQQAQSRVVTTVAETPTLDAILSVSSPPMLAKKEDVRKELALVHPDEILQGEVVEEDDPELKTLAEQQVAALLMLPTDAREREQARQRNRTTVETMGRKLQTDAAHRSKMLQQPVRKIAHLGGEGSAVANGLAELAVKIQENDPNTWDFGPGWIGKLLGKAPVIGEKIQEYFIQFETAEEVIDQIVVSLRNGAGMLERDNLILADDQSEMRILTHNFQRLLKVGKIMDQMLEQEVQKYAQGHEMQAFIREELLFGLKQRLIDIGQQLTINQQGVLAVEILMRNNIELVRGVNRALDVTVSAMRIAMIVAVALADQGMIISKINLMNKVGSDMVAETAKRLHQQGVEIHKQAASAMLEMTKVKEAWEHVTGAMNDLSTFRHEALAQMSETILELDRMTIEGEKSIQKMERGNALRPKTEASLQ